MLLGDKIPAGRIIPVSATSIEVLLPGTTSPWGAGPPLTAPMDMGEINTPNVPDTANRAEIPWQIPAPQVTASPLPYCPLEAPFCAHFALS